MVMAAVGHRVSRSGLALPLLLALVAGAVGGGVVVGAPQLWGNDENSSSSHARGCDVVAIAKRVLPSVVTLSVAGSQGSGTGSGVLVRTPIPGAGDAGKGARAGTYIVTNEHVVAPGGTVGKVTVTYDDGVSTAADVVGVDALTDLAVVTPDDLHGGQPVQVGRSARLQVGQPVVALGAPLGLNSTVTAGIVSATDRYVRVPSSAGSNHHLVGAIQTDASVNPGNSGGALVSCSGELVGINSAGASPPGGSGSVGLNFAIPSTLFAPLATELIAAGRVRHPTLGMQVAATPSTQVDREPRSPGLFVQGVDNGGPAQRAGIQRGDFIEALDDKPIRTPADLAQAELTAEIGDSVKVTYVRSGARSSVTLTVASAD
jgi:putative serine protease PepD